MSGGGASKNPMTTVALVGLAAAAIAVTGGLAAPAVLAGAAGGVAVGAGADKMRNDSLAARHAMTQQKAAINEANIKADTQIRAQQKIENDRAFAMASSRAATLRAGRGGGQRSLLSGAETGLRNTLG